MPLQSNYKKTAFFGLGAVALFTAGWLYMEHDMSPVMQKVLDEKTKASSVPTPAKIKSVQASPAPATPLLATQVTGQLRSLTERLRTLEEVKLDVAIAQQRAKLAELNAPPVSLSPQSAALPPLPPLPLPAISSGETLPSLPLGEPALPVRTRHTRLVCVRGVEGALVAIVATPKGRKTVRTGERLNGKTVANIDLESLTLRSGKNTETLMLE